MSRSPHYETQKPKRRATHHAYIEKSSRKFKASFRKSHSQGLVEKRHDAHHPLECFYTDTDSKRERKESFDSRHLNTQTKPRMKNDEMLNQSRMKARDKA